MLGLTNTKGKALLKLMAAFAVVAAAASTAYAQRGELRQRVSDLENQVVELENNKANKRAIRRLRQRVVTIEERLVDIEDYLYGSGGSRQPVHEQITHICSLKDSGYGRTHLGEAGSSLEAEYEARKACEKSTHDSYCGSRAVLKCDSTTGQKMKHICVFRDSGYGKSHKGEGRTAVEAEAKARKACEASTHDSYCGTPKARCDSSYVYN